MPDLESLRTLAPQVQPPALETLEEVARRRARRAAVSAALAGAVAVVAVVAGAVLVNDRVDRSLPEPVITPTPSVTATGSPSPRPSPTASATHQSATSMTPKEVVQKPNARMLLTGVSADDSDFRTSVWMAPCTWCPNDDEARGRPYFYGLAITNDGFATTTYLRPPWELSGLEHVESPGPGLLLIIDAANGPEWLVRDDGTITRLARVVEQRRPADPRLWHVCGDNLDTDYQLSWCALDPAANTIYVWQGPWRSTMNSSESIVSPGGTDEPWGLYWIRPDYYTPPARELIAFWHVDGVRRTRDFGPAETSGEVWNLPRGVMSVWALDEKSHTLTVWSSTDRGASWQASRLDAPWSSRTGFDDGFHSRALAISRTPDGGMLALQEDAFFKDGSPHEGEGFRMWRAESSDGGGFVNVFESKSPLDAPGEYSRRFLVVDGRIWSNGLWSDDDGRTWIPTSVWR